MSEPATNAVSFIDMDADTLEHVGSQADLGRRERKKIETRAALVRAAVELFTARGVHATTVEDIADAVDVSPRTFHRYFSSKEEVLFADATARREQFAAVLAARPAEEPLLDSLRAAAEGMASSFLAHPDDELRRLRLIRSNATLRAVNLDHTDQWSQLVAEHAAARLGQTPRDPLPLLLGACTVAALRTSVERWLDTEDADYSAELDRCFELLGDLGAATIPQPVRRAR